MGQTTELLISSDGHAKVSHEQVKDHLPKKYHEAYDAWVIALRNPHLLTAEA